jgi:hypothetical protein
VRSQPRVVADEEPAPPPKTAGRRRGVQSDAAKAAHVDDQIPGVVAPVIYAPRWDDKAIRAAARTNFTEEQATEVCEAIQMLPNGIGVRIFWLVHKYGMDTAFGQAIAPDIEYILGDYHGLGYSVTDANSPLVYPSNLVILVATLLGISGLPDPRHWLSDEACAIMDGENPKDRNATSLQAYTLAPTLRASTGDLQCHCETSPAYFKPRALAAYTTPSHNRCATGACRFHMVHATIKSVGEKMKEMRCERLPLFFCPDHPGQPIKIDYRLDDNKNPIGVFVKCTAVTTDANRIKRYCNVSEELFTRSNNFGLGSAGAIRLMNLLFQDPRLVL